MTAFVDTDVLVRHLTGDPPEMADKATAFIAAADRLLLPDVIVAEVAYVLQSFYKVPRERVAEVLRDIVVADRVVVADSELLLRTVEIYEVHRLSFADAYLIASAEQSGIDVVASFDRDLDRVGTVRRLEPQGVT